MANATPSADVAPALLALEAEARISGVDGDKKVPLGEFFVGPGKTVLGRSDILTELIIPSTLSSVRGEYIKFSPREMMDLAYVGVAVALVLDELDKRCQKARIALGAVAPTPVRARNAERLLEGQIITEQIAEQAGEEASLECSPISDVRSSADYRRQMVRVNTKRAILNAVADRPDAFSWVLRRDRRY